MKKRFLIFLCFIGILFCIQQTINKNKISNNIPQENNTEQISQNPETEKSIEVADKFKNTQNVNITVNYPVDLTKFSKKDVYDLRKQFISKSIFANPNYEPSDFVFGQIVDYKPWMSVYICEKPDSIGHNIEGPSEESRFIVNPTILVALEYPFYLKNKQNETWCNSKETMLIPKSVSYSGAAKEITVTYKKLPVNIENNSFYQFNGINARDLGYRYIYIDKSKSTYIPQFTNENNPANEVEEFNNFLHLGSSCRHPEGCNNGSPRQPAFEFTYNTKDYSQQNVRIYIKLWKEYPQSFNTPADINEIIVIEEI